MPGGLRGQALKLRLTEKATTDGLPLNSVLGWLVVVAVYEAMVDYMKTRLRVKLRRGSIREST